MSRDESIVDDTSSVGNKEDDEDDEEDGNDDEKFEGMSGDPERLKAFNVSVNLNSASCYHPPLTQQSMITFIQTNVTVAMIKTAIDKT